MESPIRNVESEERLNFYYSPFRRDRSLNPHSWDSKIKFWEDSVLDYCNRNKILVFNSKALPNKLSKNSRIPQSLDVVINDMLKKGSIQKYSDYAYSCNSSWLSWSFNYLVKKPMKWSFNKFVTGSLSWVYNWISKGDEDDYNLNLFTNKHTQLPDEEFVVLDLAKQAAREIYTRHNESVTYDITDNVVDYEVLRQRCLDICSDEISFKVVILELCRQKLCTVKVGPDGENLVMMVSNKASKSPMSGNELKIHKLKTAQAKMEIEITKTEKQMDECVSNAKVCLQQGKKNIAMKHMRKKKGLEKILHQREQVIDKIDNLLSIIQETESQKHILDAYSSGVQAFKGLREKSGFTENKIDETMLDIQEAFEFNEEINQTLSRPVPDSDGLEQDDLEAELNEILGIGKIKNLIPDILNLPEVPSHEPQVIPTKPIKRSIIN